MRDGIAPKPGAGALTFAKTSLRHAGLPGSRSAIAYSRDRSAAYSGVQTRLNGRNMMAASAQDSSDWLSLSGRVAVVTGGGGGIGRATAVSFAKAGAKVAIIDRDEKGLEATRSELHALGAAPVVAPCDTTDE